MAERVDTDWDFKTCYGCGKQNPHGLQLPLHAARLDGDSTTVEIVVPEHFTGWPGMLHGGPIAAILDEVIGYHCWLAWKVPTVTAALDVRYRKPVPAGQPLTVVATGTRDGDRRIEARGAIRDANGATLAEATARMVVASGAPTAPTA